MAKRLLLILFSLLLAGCNLPSNAPLPSSTPVEISASNPLLLVAPPGSTATPTPFLPDAPTQTYIPTNFPTATPTLTPTPTVTPTPLNPWGSFAGPSEIPDVAIPNQMGMLGQPEGQINFLLLGSDRRPDTGGFRTDTIHLITVNPSGGNVSITSFPRDLYVYIPGWTMQRINTAFPHGGFSLMQETFEYNFGVKPDYYALINFQSFKDVVDSLGGIDVYVGRTFTDHRDGYGNYTVYAGSNRMDGETALWYARARYTSSDFDRTRRQQEVIMGIFYRFLNFDIITKAPQLYDTYKRNVETNIPLEAVTQFVPMIPKVSDGSAISHYYISSANVDSYRTSGGAAVLLPHYGEIKEIMKQALHTP